MSYDDRITFKCIDCQHPVVIDASKAPDDNDVLSCQGCGRQFGTYSQVKEAIIEAGKKQINEMIDKAGLPDWIVRK
jgi:hypothetical protein